MSGVCNISSLGEDRDDNVDNIEDIASSRALGRGHIQLTQQRLQVKTKQLLLKERVGIGP